MIDAPVDRSATGAEGIERKVLRNLQRGSTSRLSPAVTPSYAAAEPTRTSISRNTPAWDEKRFGQSVLAVVME